MENWGENTKMAVGNNIMRVNRTFLFLKELYDDTFWEKKFGTHKWKIVDISMAEWSKSTNKKSKIAKIDKNWNLDLEVVAHSKTVENSSKTPKLSIFKRMISSL